MYPVSRLKVLTELRKNLFGISDPGGVPFSKQSGHSLSSDSSKAVRIPADEIFSFLPMRLFRNLHSSQNELPQHGIITASV